MRIAAEKSETLNDTDLGKIPARLSVTGLSRCSSYSSEVLLVATGILPFFVRGVRSPILTAGIPPHIS